MRLLRSMLFVPGNRSGMIRKAATSSADAIVLDLEDAVPIAEKNAAREIIRGSLPWLRELGAQVYVRVNPFSTDLIDSDLEQVIRPGCSGIILPKVGKLADVESVSEQINKFEKRHIGPAGNVSIVPLVESAAGVLNAVEIAEHEHVIALAFGALDYAHDLGITLTTERTEIMYPRSFLPIAARASNKAAMDAPWFDLTDDEGLLRDATLARALGFHGKMVIHPRQLDIVNTVFSPRDDDIEWARKVISAFEEASLGGNGVVSLEGKMIDKANYRNAQDLVKRAEDIHAKERSVEEDSFSHN